MLALPLRRLGRVWLLALLCVCAGPGEARADWLVMPFIGFTFGTSTGLLQLDVGAAESKHAVYGGSAAWLSDGILGVEGDVAFAPGFFQQDAVADSPLQTFTTPAAFNLVLSSRVTTVFGNVIAAIPLAVTRESLRPFVLGGVGLVDVHIQDTIGLVEPSRSLGLQLGGGALGFVTDRVGVRFDLRQTRTLSRTDTILGEREKKLSFWRATVGAVVRF